MFATACQSFATHTLVPACVFLLHLGDPFRHAVGTELNRVCTRHDLLLGVKAHGDPDPSSTSLCGSCMSRRMCRSHSRRPRLRGWERRGLTFQFISSGQTIRYLKHKNYSTPTSNQWRLDLNNLKMQGYNTFLKVLFPNLLHLKTLILMRSNLSWRKTLGHCCPWGSMRCRLFVASVNLCRVFSLLNAREALRVQLRWAPDWSSDWWGKGGGLFADPALQVAPGTQCKNYFSISA